MGGASARQTARLRRRRRHLRQTNTGSGVLEQLPGHRRDAGLHLKRAPGGQAEMLEDPADDGRLLEGCDHLHGSVAA